MLGLPAAGDIADLIFENTGKVDAAVIFDVADDPSGFSYRLWVNNTAAAVYARNNDPWHYEAIQSAVDAAILSETGSVDFSVAMEPFPDSSKSAEGGGVGTSGFAQQLLLAVRLGGGTLMVMGVTMCGIITLNMLTAEKRAALVGTMRMMGLREGAYWLTWLLPLLGLNLLTAALLALVAATTDVLMFSDCASSVHVLATFFFLTATNCMAMACAAVVESATWSSAVGFMLFLIATMMHMLCGPCLAPTPPRPHARAPSRPPSLTRARTLSLALAQT